MSDVILRRLGALATRYHVLNGKYDFFFPAGTAQRPFFERLGTVAADKKYFVYEGGHDVPRPRLIAETLAWLDKYLGPVKP